MQTKTIDPVEQAQIDARREAAHLDRIAEALRNARKYAKDEETDEALRRMADRFIGSIENMMLAIDQSDPHLQVDDLTHQYICKSMVRGIAYSAQNGLKWTNEKLGQARDDLAKLYRENSSSEITANRIERVADFITQLRNQVVLWTVQRDAAAAVYADQFGEVLQLAAPDAGKKHVTAANARAKQLLDELGVDTDVAPPRDRHQEPEREGRTVFDNTKAGASANGAHDEPLADTA